MSHITGSDDTFQGFSARRVRAGNVTPTRHSNPEDPRHTQTRSPAPVTRDSSPTIPPPVFVTPGPRPPTRNHSPNPFLPAGETEGEPEVPAPEEPEEPPAGQAGPGTPHPQPDPTVQLAGAIAYLAQTITYDRATQNQNQSGASSERNNVREPDQFDGTEPTKLRLFFAQLELVFKARPRTFNSEEKKVTYGISYLKGTALQWFEPYLLESDSENPPIFMTDYETFKEELRVNFGPYDASGAAEHDLMNLRMSDNHRIAKYITQFTRLATQVRWGNAPLRYRFYDGLPNRLKDRISEVGKPTTLVELRDLAQSIDNRYWERKSEQSRDSGTSKSGGKSGSSDSKPAQQNKSSNSGSSNTPKPAQSSGSKPAAKTPAKPYADKLGKDGKLSPEERQRRFTNNLCLFCGGAGHSANACPKKTSSAAKARAATAGAPAPAAAAPEAPKEPKN